MFEVRFDVDDLWRRLDRARNFGLSVDKILELAALRTVKRAKATRAFNDRTGDLRRSIQLGTASYMDHPVEATMFYAGFVEARTLFLTTAFEQSERELDAALEATLEDLGF